MVGKLLCLILCALIIVHYNRDETNYTMQQHQILGLLYCITMFVAALLIAGIIGELL